MKFNKVLFSALLIALIAVASYSCYIVYSKSQERARLKEDISEVNDIMFGILSVNRWESEIKEIAEQQIQDFKLTHEQDSIVRVTVDEVLRGVILRADRVIQEDDGTFLKFLRKHAVNLFFDVEDFQKNVPKLTDAIMKKLTSEESKERLKKLVLSKLNELTEATYDSLRVNTYNVLLSKYGTNNKEEFNKKVIAKTDVLERSALNYAIVVIVIVVVFIVLCFFLKNNNDLKYILLTSSIVLAAIVLLTGVTSPMLEIDARLETMDFVLLGGNINFTNQFLFYRSKSIIEIIFILIETGKIDSIVVGILIMSFSVLFPFLKLVSMSLYAVNERFRSNSVANWMTFYSGKWSMADVIVVAIFMAYIAFQGILNNQLNGLNRNTESMTAITTNNTSLEPGFYIFLTYVIFSILLSTYLAKFMEKNIEKSE